MFEKQVGITANGLAEKPALLYHKRETILNRGTFDRA
jgi:hypothetical protein